MSNVPNPRQVAQRTATRKFNEKLEADRKARLSVPVRNRVAASYTTPTKGESK